MTHTYAKNVMNVQRDDAWLYHIESDVGFSVE